MTIVHIEIIHPSQIYASLGIPESHHISDGKFMELLRSDLLSRLHQHHVKSVTIAIRKNPTFPGNYKLFINNIRNELQEEKIRETCDSVCLDFMKKNNLFMLKNT